MLIPHRVCCVFALLITAAAAVQAEQQRPNLLIAISDDQSYPHASAYGDPAIETPAFDRVAKAGVLFRNAFTPAPGCSPMRAAFLTGREIWQLREAGTHASYFPTDLPVYTQQLQQAGYHVGMTGKGWGPGKALGWPHNPAGKSYGKQKLKSPPGISSNDYAANFADFLNEREDNQPFCFWFGATEPHRVFGKGLGKQNGVDPDKVRVPGFLPDSPEIREDIADYMYEIEWFDSHLGKMLDQLENDGLLENTLVVVTSDNGMSFPRAKANLYEYGIHMPLAIAWPNSVPGGRVNDDLVSLIDVTKSLFTAAGVTAKQSEQMPGIDLMPLLRSEPSVDWQPREYVYSGRERHSSSRFNTLGYPCRCVRTKSYLYIRNFTPERYPAGSPQKYSRVTYDSEGGIVKSQLGPEDGGYHDIDACPTLDFMIANKSQLPIQSLLDASVALRPAEELFDIQADPDCMNNLIGNPKLDSVHAELSNQLDDYLRQANDLRVTDPVKAHVWESYPRISGLRWFPKPTWAIENPTSVPQQDWLEQKRPTD
ncbi:sulfatase [Stieleria sp. JC731]|uniref:sulfatase family protein n=1 Tax=Pirellulaceae TaxID=2691357 RepID=UPI001E5FB585|nr:sulfatase [Stieleria sp. JC731]MCC9600636.1 sulfatase [Stieleria sp. JC731]